MPYQNQLRSKNSYQLPQTKRSLYHTIETKRSLSIVNELDSKSNAFLPGSMQDRNTLDDEKSLRME